MKKAGPVIIAVAVFAAAAFYFLAKRPARESAVSAPPPDETPVEKILRESEKLPPPVESPSPLKAIVEVINPPEPVAPPPVQVMTTEVFRINSNMILASVNGMPITLRDLMPVNPTRLTENNFSPEMYGSLLDRAINRELAMQEAKRRGVGLSDQQKADLEKIRQRALERDPNSFSDVHDDYDAKAEFEVRDFAGLMLQEALLAAAGGPPKYVTPELVQQYYEAHKDQYGELPADEAGRNEAWSQIDLQIRSDLAHQLADEYEKQLQVLREDLQRQADIKQFVTVGGD